MEKVLITGAGGFIGKKIGKFLCEKGYEVYGWGRKSDHSIFFTKEINMVDLEAIETELRNVNPNIIIHCAGSADVAKSIHYPEEDFEGNVKVTHNLLFALHKLGMKSVRVVFLSSAGVYGNPKVLPISEEIELNPMSPYAVHKVMCEDLCKYFVNIYNMNIKVARIFSAYGQGLKKQIFWDMYNKSRETGELNMFGTGYESRDYIHIEDVVQAIYLLATTKSEYIFFNVANGEEVTIKEATECFAEASNLDKKKIVFNGCVREGDPLNWKADISRISELGYRKTIGMKQGVEDYVNWLNRL